MRKNDLKEFDIDVSRIDAVVRLFLSETLSFVPLGADRVKGFGAEGA